MNVLRVIHVLEVLRLSEVVVRNLFQRETLCLLKKEEGTDSNDSIRKAPEEECSPTHVFDHVWRDPRKLLKIEILNIRQCDLQGENKVEQPLR